MTTLFSSRTIANNNKDKGRSLHQARGRAFVALAVILALSACVSVPPDRVALNTLKSLRVTAESAVAVFKAGRLQVPPLFSDAQEAQARDLYGKYLAADKIAAEALLVAKQTDDFTALTATVVKAAADLAAFVNSLKKGP